MLVSCLCVTHERPEWMPWLLHQFHKQEGLRDVDTELVVIDSSKVPLAADSPSVRVISCDSAAIATKRNVALSAANGSYIAWFDDDDWSSPRRLARLLKARDCEDAPQIVGTVWGTRYDVVTGRSAPYFSLEEPVIFNSALYSAELARSQRFNARLMTGEDTDWNLRLLQKRPSWSVIGQELHAWMCHGRNVSNRNSSTVFDLPSSIPFDAWEIDFLKGFGA